jgi:peptidylprolyl isomerase
VVIASRTAFTLTALAALGLALAGCGGSNDGGAASSGSPDPSAPAGCEVQVTGAQGSKPQVTVPDCPAPATLQVKDLIAGTGDPVKAGDVVAVHYTLYGWDGRSLVQSSYDTGQPFSVQDVGKAQVIDGWNQGLVGIKQGARRLLVVPAALGYRDQGTPDGTIKPNEALVFVVDAVQVSPAR